jgi:repressor LexA
MEYRIFENLLKMNKTSVYRVSKATGISGSTFTDWKNGRSVPKIDKLKLIADHFDVPLAYMLGEEAASDCADGVKIPIIGEIRAGSPIITNETLLGYEYADVSSSTDEYFYLKICGDSMKDIGMIDGSLVLFRKQQYAEEGDIVACLVGGDSATVKRFSRVKKNIYLLPENEEYSPIHLTTDDFESGEARILGVAQEIKIKL